MEPFKYALRHTTRTGLLSELKAKGFEFGTYSEDGEFTEIVPEHAHTIALKCPIGATAVYLEKCPTTDPETGEEVKLTKWHANVASPTPIEWDVVEVVEGIVTPYNVV